MATRQPGVGRVDVDLRPGARPYVFGATGVVAVTVGEMPIAARSVAISAASAGRPLSISVALPPSTTAYQLTNGCPSR
jgi:hypothetical protein